MHVSDHAIRRYRERVSPIDAEEARAAMMAHEPAVTIAARFGCDTVKLGNGVRLKLRGDVVATVLGNGKAPRAGATVSPPRQGEEGGQP